MSLNTLKQIFGINFTKKGDFLKIKNGDSPLTYALYNNNKKFLNLSIDDFDILITNSDLKYKDEQGWTPLLCALEFNKDENVIISNYAWEKLINESDLLHKNVSGLSAYGFVKNKYERVKNILPNELIEKILLVGESIKENLIEKENDLFLLKKVEKLEEHILKQNELIQMLIDKIDTKNNKMKKII